MVGLDGVEPSTSRLSGVRSNQTELQAHDIVNLNINDWRLKKFNMNAFCYSIVNLQSNWAHHQLYLNFLENASKQIDLSKLNSDK